MNRNSPEKNANLPYVEGKRNANYQNPSFRFCDAFRYLQELNELSKPVPQSRSGLQSVLTIQIPTQETPTNQRLALDKSQQVTPRISQLQQLQEHTPRSSKPPRTPELSERGGAQTPRRSSQLGELTPRSEYQERYTPRTRAQLDERTQTQPSGPVTPRARRSENDPATPLAREGQDAALGREQSASAKKFTERGQEHQQSAFELRRPTRRTPELSG